MRVLLAVLLLFACASCSVPVRNIKKVQYYEPTSANVKYCVQPAKDDPGHGPIKSIQYQVKQKVDFNFNIKNSAVGL